MGLSAAERFFLSFKLETQSRRPQLPATKDTRFIICRGLSRLATFDFPVHLFDVTRAFFERTAQFSSGQTAADLKTVIANPAIPRRSPGCPHRPTTTRFCAPPASRRCSPRVMRKMRCPRVHGNRELPPLPVDKPEDVERTLKTVLADPKINVSVLTAASPAVRSDRSASG